MAESLFGNKAPCVLPTPHGELSSRYALLSEIGMGRGPNLYVLDTVESSIEQAKSMMEHKGKRFDPGQGLITFACSDAIDERCIAEAYLPHAIKTIRDGAGTISADHYENLHFYDISIDENREYLFNALGTAHEIDIFKALMQSEMPNIDTPQASLFIMKGIEFFEKGDAQNEAANKRLRVFQKYLPNFLNDIALVFITADSPALKNVPGFTRIRTGDREIEKESDLDVYLYQRNLP